VITHRCRQDRVLQYLRYINASRIANTVRPRRPALVDYKFCKGRVGPDRGPSSRPQIGIRSQNARPSRAIWADPVNATFVSAAPYGRARWAAADPWRRQGEDDSLLCLLSPSLRMEMQQSAWVPILRAVPMLSAHADFCPRPPRGVYAPFTLSTANRFCMSSSYGRGGRLTTLFGGGWPRAGEKLALWIRMVVVLPGDLIMHREYDAFGIFGAIFRELEWKTPIFSWRAFPKTPNTLYERGRAGGGGGRRGWLLPSHTQNFTAPVS
jgi:hypothetical protein